MSGKSGSGSILRFLFRVALVLAIVAFAQYVVLVLHISSAQTSFKNAGLDLQLSGEKKFKETIVSALGQEGFHIDPKDISISRNNSGIATIHLIAVREAKILTVPVRKEVVFHTETIYDSSL